MKLRDLLEVIDSSENVRIFCNDRYVCELDIEWSGIILKSFYDDVVESIETMQSKTCGGDTIVHLCVYIRTKEN